MTDDERVLRDALEAGPTPPVQQEKVFRGWYCAHCKRGKA